MYKKLAVLVLVTLLFGGLSVDAQTKQLKVLPQNGKSINSKRAMLSKGGNLKKSNMASRNNTPSFSDVDLNEDENKMWIKYHKVNMPTNLSPSTSNALTSIELYTANKKKVGVLNFYSDNSSNLGRKASQDEKDKVITMAYPISMFETVRNFVGSSKTLLVYDKKEKAAYLTSDVVNGK